MSTLARTEWLKIRNYKGFWWMTALIAFAFGGINYMFYRAYNDMKSNSELGGILKMLQNPFTFPEVWKTLAFLSSFFIIIPSIIVIMFITNEYTYKTHRQNIIDGWSRKQFMTSKLLDVLIVTLMITVVFIIVGLIIGYSNYTGSTTNMWDKTQYIGLYFLHTFSQLSIAFLIAFLVRRAVIALAVFLGYFIFENIGAVVLRETTKLGIERFLPLEISDRMLPVPTFIGRVSSRNDTTDWYQKSLDAINSHVLLTFLLLIITWSLCYWVNNRRDL